MAGLSHTERAILSRAGAPAAAVAAALDVSIDHVTAFRRRCGRNEQDGLPGRALLPRPPGETFEDLDREMRANRGLPA